MQGLHIGLHLALGIVCALMQRNRTGRGQKVLCAMQDGVLNLCRVKLRDQQRLKAGPLKEYTQYGEGIPFGEAVPRAANDSGGGQPGVILKCKGWETDPNAYIYFITQAPVWEKICDLIGEPGWKTHPDFAKPPARLPRLKQIFERIEQWTMTKTKFEAMDILNKYDIPCGPILSLKEIAEDQSLRKTGTVVEVNMKGRYIVVQEDTAIVTSGPSLGAPEYRYERNPNGHLNYFRKAKNGRWVNVARNPETKRFVQLGTLGLLLGERQKYFDPSF